jgi:hypothetical protein
MIVAQIIRLWNNNPVVLHGFWTRMDSERALVRGCHPVGPSARSGLSTAAPQAQCRNDGTFMIRFSEGEPGHLALAYLRDQRILHMKVSVSSAGGVLRFSVPTDQGTLANYQSLEGVAASSTRTGVARAHDAARRAFGRAAAEGASAHVSLPRHPEGVGTPRAAARAQTRALSLIRALRAAAGVRGAK